MIKAEDLRIGDLVRVREMKICRFIPEDVAYKVTQIISKDLLINNRSSVCLCLTNPKQKQKEWPISCESLLPIPLTREIFEKNEFDYLNEEVVTYSKRIHRGTILVLRPYGKVFDVIIKRNWHARDCHIRYIEYIHELQHLLWALGRNANLKI